jgi:DNA invertase Pin-like site-specific DNA recombinase
MSLYGYARVSTLDQDFAIQRAALKGAGYKGISAEKARGVCKGRKPSIDADAVLRLRHVEKLGPAAIARRLGIGRASVYRLLGKRAIGANGGGNADQG